jgi:hypothetical protein
MPSSKRVAFYLKRSGLKIAMEYLNNQVVPREVLKADDLRYHKIVIVDGAHAGGLAGHLGLHRASFKTRDAD